MSWKCVWQNLFVFFNTKFTFVWWQQIEIRVWLMWVPMLTKSTFENIVEEKNVPKMCLPIHPVVQRMHLRMTDIWWGRQIEIEWVFCWQNFCHTGFSPNKNSPPGFLTILPFYSNIYNLTFALVNLDAKNSLAFVRQIVPEEMHAKFKQIWEVSHF